MAHRWRLMVLALLSASCEQCAPHLVAQGASRLAMRNFGAIVELVNADDRCGFANAEVVASYRQLGEPGQSGRAEWRVEGCEITIDRAAPRVSADCGDVRTGVAGKVKVTATRSIEGYLTGDPKQPVIPAGPEAVTITIERADLEEFQVDSSDGPEFMVMKSGALSGKLRPLLAAAADTGVCSIPTTNVAISELRFENVIARIVTDSRDFMVPIPSSDLSAVNGRIGDRENLLSGRMTVWESEQEIPIDEDERALNPNYDADQHEAAYACRPNLTTPPRFDGCTTDIRPLIAQGAAQLSVQMIGKLTQYLDEEPRCGFVSDVVNGAVRTEGALGVRGGKGTWTAEGCEIHFPVKTEIDRDCNGKGTYAQGTVRLSGRKEVNGIPSGDRREPVVPTSRDPATVWITAEFSDFALWSDPEVHKLTVRSGRLSATAHPRVAKDTATGACSIKTPNSGFSEIAYEDARLVVESEGRRFELTATASRLEAQNGTKNGRTNYLEGTIELDGESFRIPVGDAPTLDPDYDPEHFVASYACKPNIQIPASDEDCDMRQTLAEGAGRLIVMSVGTVSSLTNADKDCGFEALRVLLRPSEVRGDPGELGSMEWRLDGCDLSRARGSEAYETDCKGRRKFAEGNIVVRAKRTVQGLREKVISIGSINLIDSIAPQNRQSVRIELERVTLANFSNWELDRGAMMSSKAIQIARGTLSAVVEPVTGENRRKPGRFDIATSIAQMSRIKLRDAPVTIHYQGKTFVLHVEDSELEAFNGSFRDAGRTNQIGGWIRVEGREFRFPPGASLDPDYGQADFDARYVCKEDLKGLVPSVP